MRLSLLWRVVNQFKQMVVLPVAFLERGSIGIGGEGCITDGSGCIDGCGDCMSANMCGRHRLTCGTGGRTRRIILFYCARSRMRRESSSTDISHLEHARLCP